MLSYLVISLIAILLSIVLIRYYEIPYLVKNSRCPEPIYKYNGEALLVAVLFTVIGARLGYVLTNWHLYVDDPWKILAIWRGGLTFHGALVAVLLALSLHSYLRRVPLMSLLDLSIPYISFSYALGRIGCFLNGCCYGHLTSMSWGMAYPGLSDALRHPTQLYSALAAFIIALILLLIHRNSGLPGLTFGWFLVLFGVYRFIVEFFRVSEPLISLLSLAQVVSLFVFLIGIALLLISILGERSDEK